MVFRSLRRRMWRWVIGLVGGAIVALGLLVHFMNPLAKQATERTLGYVLQVDVTIQAMRVQLAERRIEIDRLVIKNPEGFQTAHAMLFEKITVRADPRSFASGAPLVDDIHIDGGEVILETALGRSNLGHLRTSAARFTTRTPGDDSRATMRVVIDRILLENARLTVSARGLGGLGVGTDLAPVEITGLGRDAHPVTAARAIQLFLDRLVRAVAAKAGRGVSPDLLSEPAPRVQDATQANGWMHNLGQGMRSAARGVGDFLRLEEE